MKLIYKKIFIRYNDENLVLLELLKSNSIKNIFLFI